MSFTGSGSSFFGDNDIRNHEIGAILVFVFLSLGAAMIIIDMSSLTNDEFETLLAFVFLYVLSLFIAYAGFVKKRELSYIANTPTSKIRSMPMGMVEVKGQALEGAPEFVLSAPFSGKDCLAYMYEVQEYEQRGKNSSWVTVDNGVSDQRFLVDDGTGEVVVDPRGADFEFEDKKVYRVDSTEDANKNIREFVGDKGGPGGLIFENDRKYIEWIITPEEDVYVNGYASKEKGESSEYAVIKEDENETTFLISDKSEKQLIRSKKWKSRIYTLLGILGAITMYGLSLVYAG